MNDEKTPNDTNATEAAHQTTRLDDWDVNIDALKYTYGKPSPLEERLRREIESDRQPRPTDATPGTHRSDT